MSKNLLLLKATVLEINNDTTIKIKFDGGAIVDNVKIKPVTLGGLEALLIPKINSIVLVDKINNSGEFLIISANEISDINYIIDGILYYANQYGFLLQKGEEEDNLSDVITLNLK